MDRNYAQSERKIRETDEALNFILESVEAQHPFSKKNFVFLKRLVFLWVIGEDEQIEVFLRTEIQSIVEDKRTIWIIRSNLADLETDEIYQKFYEGIECASRNYLSIDMDHLMVCPVFLPGCFACDEAGEKLKQASVYVQREMRKRHRYLMWSPFILINDEKIEMTRKQMNASVHFMEEIIQEGRKNFQDCCCPACVISDVNEFGQAISVEQKAKIIVMLTVFRNTDCQNGETINVPMQPLARGDQKYFFTARAISICEPVKSLMLNRLLAVHNCFLLGRFSQEKVFDNINHRFFEENIWKEQLDKIAHDEKYAILTDPIYSNIPRTDSKEYEKVLMDFCKEYYIEPLSENREKLIQEWWKSFLEEFFLKQAGAVETLDSVEEQREKIIDKVPTMQVRNSGTIYVNDMRRGCENWLTNELRGYQKRLVRDAIKPEGTYMQQFRKNKEFLNNTLQNLENSIRNQIRRLRQTELLLNTGGGHVADPLDEAQHWLQDYINNEPRKITEIYRTYQKILCDMFQDNVDNAGILSSNLLKTYNQIVSGSIESRELYMKTKLANLAGSDMEQIISRLGESWMYPVRLIGNVDQNKAQRLYMLGNPDNFLCSKILNQPDYQVAFKECALDDRLEIVRVSDRLTIQQIFSQEQESEESGL